MLWRRPGLRHRCEPVVCVGVGLQRLCLRADGAARALAQHRSSHRAGPAPALAMLSPNISKGAVMPQKAWSAKRERQYVHIKDSLLERGKPEPLKGRLSMSKAQLERALKP